MAEKKGLDRLKEAVMQSVISCDAEATKSNVEKALEGGMKPQQILDEGLVVAINQVGEDFGALRVFLPELVGAAKAMLSGMEILKGHWKDMASERKAAGKVVLGTVKGDVHSIGKDIVGSFLSASGFDVLDLGVDVADETFVKQVETQKPDILGLSALLTTSMPQQKYVIEALKSSGHRETVKVIIGGAPTYEEWAKEIGSDSYAPNAALAVGYCKDMLRKQV